VNILGHARLDVEAATLPLLRDFRKPFFDGGEFGRGEDAAVVVGARPGDAAGDVLRV